MNKNFWRMIWAFDIAIIIGGMAFGLYFKAIAWSDVWFIVELLSPVAILVVAINRKKDKGVSGAWRRTP